MHFEIYEEEDAWRFRIVSPYGRVMATAAESYTTLRLCLVAIESIQGAMSNAPIYKDGALYCDYLAPVCRKGSDQ